MNKNTYVLPVSATFRDIQYPERIMKSSESLERRLKGKSLSISLGKRLSPDHAQEVYAARLDQKRVIVKHVENIVPRTPIEFLIMSDAFATETRILKLLSETEHIRIPRILHAFPKFTTIIMEDLREEGYQTLASHLLKKKLPMKSAVAIGQTFAHLAQISRTWEEFKTNESAQLSYYERSLEMLVTYPHDLKRYERLSQTFTQFDEDKMMQEELPRFFVWPNGNPSNILTTSTGNVALVDFGRVHWGDQRFMLPQFLAHIILSALAGFIPHQKAATYIQECIGAYRQIEPLADEDLFIEYLAMELLHRAFGRGSVCITSTSQILAIQAFGRMLFDKQIKTIKTMLTHLKKS